MLRKRWVWLLLGLLVLGLVGYRSLLAEDRQNSEYGEFIDLIVGNRTRSVLVHVPPQAARQKKLPLVIAFHGGGGRAEATAKITGWTEKADEAGFLVALPEGVRPNENFRPLLAVNMQTWNDGSGRFYTGENEIDDVAMTKKIIQHMIQQYQADPQRVYVTGFSNGSSMAYRVAIELDEMIAAVAPIGSSGIRVETEGKTLQVPLLSIHGAEDPLNPLDGKVAGKYGKQEDQVPVVENFRNYAKLLGHTQTPEKNELSNGVTRYAFGQRGQRNEAVLMIVPGLGHQWPGAESKPLPESLVGPASDLVNGTEEIWEFFSRHRLARVEPPKWTEGWSEHTLDFDNLKRGYRVYVPAEMTANAATVLLLHGGGQSMRRMFRENAGGTKAWPTLAEQEGFLLVVPNGVAIRGGEPDGDRQNWNDYRTHGSDANDVGFLNALLDHTAKAYQTDPQRTYVTGASNGGMMTYRLLIETPQRFAAAVAFIAALPDDRSEIEQPDRPTPLMIVAGTEDPLVKWNGGAILGNRGKVMSAADNLNWWLKANRADADAASTSKLPNADPNDGCQLFSTVYPAKADGAPVVFVKMEGSGHAMPSKAHKLPDNFLIRRLIGTTCHDLEGAELAWQFMQQHRLKK